MGQITLSRHRRASRQVGIARVRSRLEQLESRDLLSNFLPSPRTIERVLQRHGLTAPHVRLAPLRPRQEYPGPQARASNELHEVDLVGPIYLQGSGHRYYIWVGKDAFDGAVGLRLAYSRCRDEVLWFLGECWKDLGLPEQLPKSPHSPGVLRAFVTIANENVLQVLHR